MLGTCVVFVPPGPDRVRVYSVISPLASRGRCHTTSMEEEERFLVDNNNGGELGTKERNMQSSVLLSACQCIA